MESTKENITIKIEDVDDEEEATKAIEATTTNPPTRAEMKAGKQIITSQLLPYQTSSLILYSTKKDPKAYRRYVSHLATTVPSAPPYLDKDGLRKWKYRHLRTCIFLTPACITLFLLVLFLIVIDKGANVSQ